VRLNGRRTMPVLVLIGVMDEAPAGTEFSAVGLGGV